MDGKTVTSRASTRRHFDLDVVVQSAELAGILLTFTLSDATDIEHVPHRHPSVASPHSTDENRQISRMETPAVSPTPTTTCGG